MISAAEVMDYHVRMEAMLDQKTAEFRESLKILNDDSLATMAIVILKMADEVPPRDVLGQLRSVCSMLGALQMSKMIAQVCADREREDLTPRQA